MPRKRKPDASSFEVGTVRGTVDKKRGIKDGRLYWRGRMKGGTRKLVWSGWATRDEAMRAVAALVASGQPLSNRSAAPDVRSVGDLLSAWMEFQRQRPNISENTKDHYDKCARHLVAWLGGMVVEVVGQAEMEGYRDDRLRERVYKNKEKTTSPRLVVQELRIFNMAWRWGKARALVPQRDPPRVRVKLEELDRRTPTRHEAALVEQQLKGEWKLVFTLLYTTGARVNEVCRLRWMDLDFRRGVLLFGRTDGSRKTGRREFPLPQHVLSLLAGRTGRGSEPLFSLPATADQCLRGHIKQACKATGVEYFTPHGLRRMVVDRMARKGIDAATAAKLTGHSVVTMLRYYRQVSEDDLRAAVAVAGLGHLHDMDDGVIEGPWGSERSPGAVTAS